MYIISDDNWYLEYLSNFAMHKHGVQEQTSLLQCVVFVTGIETNTVKISYLQAFILSCTSNLLDS